MFGESLAAGIVEHDLHDIIAVGHSFGGVGSLVAAVRRPERFRGLVLLDPTLLLQVQLDHIFRPNADGVVEHQLAVRARVRRARFISLNEAFRCWRPRPLFRDWSDEALWGYVRSGLRQLPNESSCSLVWPADWQAHYYEGAL